MKKFDVYISSSWKNRDRVRVFAEALRKHGVSAYDFTDPSCRGTPEKSPKEPFDPSKHVYGDYLQEPVWRKTVFENQAALRQCRVCVLLLPCGNDAHADWAYAVSECKRTAVVGHPPAGERSTTHLWADVILETDRTAVLWCVNEILGDL